ncbi:phosphomannomutase/phosphoglucomutase, partial [Promicromonospora sp. NPDC090134]
MAIDLSTLVKAYDVRGVVPDQLSPHVAQALGAAFARVVVLTDAATGSADADDAGAGRPAMVIGRDMRDSGPELVDAFARGVT